MCEVPLEDVWSCRDKAYQLPSEARWCRRCRQNFLDHTLLYVVNLRLVVPVYEMWVVSGNPMSTRACIDNKVSHSIG